MEGYARINGVTMKPGTPVYVCDRDDPNYDAGGTIVSVESGGYIVQFGKSRNTRFSYSLDQIMPLDTTRRKHASGEHRVNSKYFCVTGLKTSRPLGSCISYCAMPTCSLGWTKQILNLAKIGTMQFGMQ